MSGWTWVIVIGQLFDLAGVGIVAYFTFPPAYAAWKRTRGLPDAGHDAVDTDWLPSPAEIRGLAAASLVGFGLMGLGFFAQALGTIMGVRP